MYLSDDGRLFHQNATGSFEGDILTGIVITAQEENKMNKQTWKFATQKRNNEVVKIGRSFIEQPKVHYTGTGTKWFDDTKLLKRK